MSFDQSVITEVQSPIYAGGQLWLSWTSTAPSGTWYQLYLGRKLAWYGQATHVGIVSPQGRQRVDVGSVAATEKDTDFSSSLPATPQDRAKLAWQGGTYLDASGNDDILGFRVYGESSPGGGINFATPLATVPAYPGGIITDGYGLGGFGQGGYGRAANSYTWESAPLRSGTWHYSVKSYDAAGNEGTAAAGSVTIAVPPQPPARNAAGSRLTYTYNATTHQVTLNWLASPG